VVKLGTSNPNGRCSTFADGTWLTCSRITIGANLSEAAGNPVLPGETARVYFNFHPTNQYQVQNGSYTEYFNMVADGYTWMPCAGSCMFWTVTTGYFQSCYVSQSDPSGVLTPGDTYTATVTYRNCGNVPWWGYEIVKLGYTGSGSSPFSDSSWWTPGLRATGVTFETDPGSSYTFTYHLHVPCSQGGGAYAQTFDPVAEYVTWMNSGNYAVHFTVGTVPDLQQCGVPLP
jgi:hypothetical protein